MQSRIIYSKNSISIALCSAYVEFTHSGLWNRFWNLGRMRVTGLYYPLSGRDSVLLCHPPLRTVRTSFPVYGSSLNKLCLIRTGSYFLFTVMDLSMTVRM